jgi:hypothetical protein
MNDLVVDRKLASLVTHNLNTNAAAAIAKGFGQLVKHAFSFNHRQPLSDIPRFGHGNHSSIITYVKDTVLLEDRPKHSLYDDAWSRGRYKAGLLMELLGEDVDTKIVQLTGVSRGRDADDLADMSLQDQEIAITDVVARDTDGVGGTISPGGTGTLAGHWGRSGGLFANFAFDDHFLAVVMTMMVERVEDTVSCSL